MKKFDYRIDELYPSILKKILNKELTAYYNDEFIYGNNTYGVAGLNVNGEYYQITNFIEVLDYFGDMEDVAVFKIIKSRKEDMKPVVDLELIETLVRQKVKQIKLVNETQKFYEDNVQTYEVKLTRGIFFVMEDGLEIGFGKDIWFSENIVVIKGDNGERQLLDVDIILDSMEDPCRITCDRETVILE